MKSETFWNEQSAIPLRCILAIMVCDSQRAGESPAFTPGDCKKHAKASKDRCQAMRKKADYILKCKNRD